MTLQEDEQIKAILEELRPDNPGLTEKELEDAAEAVLRFRTPDIFEVDDDDCDDKDYD